MMQGSVSTRPRKTGRHIQGLRVANLSVIPTPSGAQLMLESLEYAEQSTNTTVVLMRPSEAETALVGTLNILLVILQRLKRSVDTLLLQTMFLDGKGNTTKEELPFQEGVKMSIPKIRHPHNDNDRVICVASKPNGQLDFFFQRAGSNDRKWLLWIPFSGSIFCYFRDHGRNLEGYGWSLTIRQIYQFHDFSNPKLSRLISRLPGTIDYVLREERGLLNENPIMMTTSKWSSFEKMLKNSYYVNHAERSA